MIITKQIAESLIDKHKHFAPLKARVMLIHKDDARVFYAEKFEQGCAFWAADTRRESVLQGLIHKLELVAKRNDKGDWVAVTDFKSKPTTTVKKPTRLEKIVKTQELVYKKRVTTPPAVVSPVEEKEDLPPSMKLVNSIEPGRNLHKPDSESLDPFEGLMSLKSFYAPGPKPDVAMMTIRKKANVFRLNPIIKEKIGVDHCFDILVNPEDGRIAIVLGRKVFTMKEKPCFTSKSFAKMVDCPDNAVFHIEFEWDEKHQAFFGNMKQGYVK